MSFSRILHGVFNQALRLALSLSLVTALPRHADAITLDWTKVHVDFFPDGAQSIRLVDAYKKVRATLPPEMQAGTDFYFSKMSESLTVARPTVAQNKVFINTEAHSLAIEFVRQGDIFARFNGVAVTVDDFYAVRPLVKKLLGAINQKPTPSAAAGTLLDTLWAAVNPLPAAHAMESSYLPILLIALLYSGFYLFNLFGPITPREPRRRVTRATRSTFTDGPIANERRPIETGHIPRCRPEPGPVSLTPSCDYQEEGCNLGNAVTDFQLSYEDTMSYFCGDDEARTNWQRPASWRISTNLTGRAIAESRANLDRCLLAAERFSSATCAERQPLLVRIQNGCDAGHPHLVMVCDSDSGVSHSHMTHWNLNAAHVLGVSTGDLHPCSVHRHNGPIDCSAFNPTARDASPSRP